MIYNVDVIIRAIDKEYYLELLSNIEKGCKEDFRNIACVNIENGYTLYIDLCSGDYNYYLQYELVDKNNNVVAGDILDADFEDFSIADNNTCYKIHFKEY